MTKGWVDDTAAIGGENAYLIEAEEASCKYLVSVDAVAIG